MLTSSQKIRKPGKMLDIYEKALKDIRVKIKSGERSKTRKIVEKAATKLYGSKIDKVAGMIAASKQKFLVVFTGAGVKHANRAYRISGPDGLGLNSIPKILR